MAANMLLVDVESDDGVAIIYCNGELDLSVCGDLREAIERVSTPALSLLRIDTSGLSFMDSSGLHCLIETERRCREHGTRLEVIPSRPVSRLLKIAGVADIFTGSPECCR
jgi:anti-anti-sigma factor